MNQCKHPRVQIVSRDEDTEYVECLECGDVFESSEFKDMAIEESAQSDEAPNGLMTQFRESLCLSMTDVMVMHRLCLLSPKLL